MSEFDFANFLVMYLNTWDEEKQIIIKKWCVFHPKTHKLYTTCDTYEEAYEISKKLVIEVANNE